MSCFYYFVDVFHFCLLYIYIYIYIYTYSPPPGSTTRSPEAMGSETVLLLLLLFFFFLLLLLLLSVLLLVLLLLLSLWFLAEEHMVRDITRCAVDAGNIEVSPTSSRKRQTCHFRKRATSAPAEGPAYGIRARFPETL